MYFKSHKVVLLMDIKTKIGLRIMEIRTEKELTQEAVAFEFSDKFLHKILALDRRRNLSTSSLPGQRIA